MERVGKNNNSFAFRAGIKMCLCKLDRQENNRFVLFSGNEHVFVKNIFLLDRHANMLSKRICFVFLNGREFHGLI